MNCFRTSPEDTALQCTRPATQRFKEQVLVAVPLQMSHTMAAHAYTCDQHAEHGPALAHEQALAWFKTLGIIEVTDTCQETYDPTSADANGDGWVMNVKVGA